MKRLITGLLALCGAFLLTTGAFAQDRDRDRDRGEYWEHERLAREWRSAFYDRLQRDLDHAEHDAYLRGDDFRRFDRAHREVGEFAAKWEHGAFDPHDMDMAIESVQRVVDIRNLRPGDRDALRDDLVAMRRFRAHMEGRR
jgi:hypothetical protein